jgi:hypothetical protein
MPAMRRNLLLLLVLVGCGDSSNNNTDATVAGLDCATYCNEIQMNCTGTNAQYADPAHCMAACPSFPVGALGDTSGNTLGCRIYHGGAPAVMDPVLHCPHAGPGGDKTSVVAPPAPFCGDACTSFCTLEIKACGVTGDAGGNGQYASMAACVSACAAFPNSTHLYGPTAKGDSLACRLYHAWVIHASREARPRRKSLTTPRSSFDKTGHTAPRRRVASLLLAIHIGYQRCLTTAEM